MIDMQAEHRRLTGEDMLSEAEIVSRAQHRLIFSGVYFLIKNDRIVYVGQAQDVDLRIEQHRQDKDFDSFTYVQAFGGQLDVLESMYIHHYQPELNAGRGSKIVAPLRPDAIAGTRKPLKALSGLTLVSEREKRKPNEEMVLNLDAIK